VIDSPFPFVSPPRGLYLRPSFLPPASNYQAVFFFRSLNNTTFSSFFFLFCATAPLPSPFLPHCSNFWSCNLHFVFFNPCFSIFCYILFFPLFLCSWDHSCPSFPQIIGQHLHFPHQSSIKISSGPFPSSFLFPFGRVRRCHLSFFGDFFRAIDCLSSLNIALGLPPFQRDVRYFLHVPFSALGEPSSPLWHSHFLPDLRMETI